MLIILLLTFFVNSFAQPVTEDGVVVNQAGDTTVATITIPRSDKNPTYIDVTQGDTTKRYRPHEIRYFRFGEGAPATRAPF